MLDWKCAWKLRQEDSGKQNMKDMATTRKVASGMKDGVGVRVYFNFSSGVARYDHHDVWP